MIGFIYKITNSVDNREYVGSSKDVNKRFALHKFYSESPNYRAYDMKLCQCIRELGFDKFSIEIIETITFTEKAELLEREKFHINDLSSSLNTIKNPIISAEETKIQRAEYHKTQMETNPEYKAKKAAYHKTQMETNPEYKSKKSEYGKEYCQKPEVKAKQQAYIDANPETVKQTKKDCYEKHKDKYLADAKIRYENNMGVVKERSKARHEAKKNDVEYIAKRRAASKAYREKQKLLNVDVVCECGAKLKKNNLPRHKKKAPAHIAFLSCKAGLK